jgi:hypothetical protein
MTVLTLHKHDIYIQFINTLIDSGWQGKWEIIGDEIKIHNTSGTLRKTKGNLNYHQGLQLSMCLAIQLAYLNSIHKSILFFSKDDITIINDEWFLITNLERIVPIIEKNTVLLSQPISLKGFLSPELENISELPFKTNVSSCYYSLALLVINCLEIDQDLHAIANSKLYFFLYRCLKKTPEDRFLLFI